MGKVVGIITARMHSSRLPGKVMLDMCGKSVFSLHVERMKAVRGLSAIYLATSRDKINTPLIEESRRLKIKYYRGAKEDILERNISVLNKERADAALRITCDMPLFDIDSLSRFVSLFKKKGYDYIYAKNMSIVHGTVGELISLKSMLTAHKSYKGAAITQPIKENIKNYKTLGINIPKELCRPEYRLTLDYPEDFKVINFIYQNLYKNKPISLYDVYKLMDDNPDTARINSNTTIKKCNIFGANFLDLPKYSIVKSNRKYIIFDEDKKEISFEKFFKKLKIMFSSELQ